MKKTFIYVTTQKEFIHQYKDAPEEVEYLRYPHRHVAHIKIRIQVFDNNRELEFIMLKHRLDRYLSELLDTSVLSNRSCETIANSILSFLIEKYGSNRDMYICVSEDGENGCELYYEE